MNAIPKRKLCWHCEGEMACDEDSCPYCGVHLNGEAMPQLHSRSRHEQTPQNEEESDKASAIPPLLKSLCGLLVGFNLALFALILFLFGEDGLFTLQWKSSYWYIYLLISLPFLGAGWRYLQQLPAEDEEL